MSVDAPTIEATLVHAVDAAPPSQPLAQSNDNILISKISHIDTTVPHNALTELSNAENAVESSQIAHSEVISFNPGHMEWLQKDFPDLFAQVKIYEKNGVRIEGLLPENIVTYLQEHGKDDPHAIETFFAILGNELRQKFPLKLLKGQKEDEEMLADLDDPNEKMDLEDSITRGKPILLKCVAEVATHIIAVDRLLNDPDMKQLIANYMHEYANVERTHNGAPTGKTYAKFLEDWQNIVIKRRNELEEEMNHPEMKEFLIAEGHQKQ